MRRIRTLTGEKHDFLWPKKAKPCYYILRMGVKVLKRTKEINDFIHQAFDMYRLDFKDFFNELVDEEEDEHGIPYGGHLVELPLVVGDIIDMDLLEKAAKALGVTAEALLHLDKDAVQRWYKKYPYFELRKKFDIVRNHSKHFSGSAEEMLIASILDKDYHPDNYKRYKDNIKSRLAELLKSYASVMPECYHGGASISKLTICTNNFTHFDQIVELAESYLSMANRARELFYQLWDKDLCEDEIREYNFLVSVFGMRDMGYAPRPIYYDLARKFAPVYKQEKYTDYASYIGYQNADYIPFYTCTELFDYPELIDRLAREFPALKAQLSIMAIMAKSFLCSFIWSDEPEPPVDDTLDELRLGMLPSESDGPLPWYHRVYVPKTAEELHGEEKYIEACKRLSAPASQGGLKISIPQCKQTSCDDYYSIQVQRMMARFRGGVQHE